MLSEWDETFSTFADFCSALGVEQQHIPPWMLMKSSQTQVEREISECRRTKNDQNRSSQIMNVFFCYSLVSVIASTTTENFTVVCRRESPTRDQLNLHEISHSCILNENIWISICFAYSKLEAQNEELSNVFLSCAQTSTSFIFAILNLTGGSSSLWCLVRARCVHLQSRWTAMKKIA